MGKGRPAGTKNKERKPKKVNVVVFKRDDALEGTEKEAYRLLDSVIKTSFPDLKAITVNLAWRKGVPQDTEGKVWVVKLYLKDEMNRQEGDVDAAIQINHTIWAMDDFDDTKKRAALDFALCGIGVRKFDDGEIRLDENERVVIGRKKSDGEFYLDNIKRYGLWHESLSEMVEAATEAASHPLLQHPAAKKKAAKEARAQA